TYTGITYEFWRSLDAVGDESSYVMLGTPNCGKGEPGQGGHVGHGCSGARFRNVQVGVGKWGATADAGRRATGRPRSTRSPLPIARSPLPGPPAPPRRKRSYPRSVPSS